MPDSNSTDSATHGLLRKSLLVLAQKKRESQSAIVFKEGLFYINKNLNPTSQNQDQTLRTLIQEVVKKSPR